MESSDQTTEVTDSVKEEPRPYHCVVVAQLHARVKNGKRKRPAHALLGKRTNAILDKHGLRSIIPRITLTETECNDDKYTHYTSMITFETDKLVDGLELAINEVLNLLVSSTNPRFFSQNNILDYHFDLKQSSSVELAAAG